jgi:hypothetical protein
VEVVGKRETKTTAGFDRLMTAREARFYTSSWLGWAVWRGGEGAEFRHGRAARAGRPDRSFQTRYFGSKKKLRGAAHVSTEHADAAVTRGHREASLSRGDNASE